MVLMAPGPVQAQSKGPVMVTVSGNISASNRPAFDGFADGFFKFHDKTFKSAFAFDRAMLAGLKQMSALARAVKWKASVRFTGPLLRDVLAKAGALDRTITVFALDGYAVKFTPKELAQHPWVLAIEADGKPLGIGGRGPAWLVHATTKGTPATESQEAKWVWSIFYMEAE